MRHIDLPTLYAEIYMYIFEHNIIENKGDGPNLKHRDLLRNFGFQYSTSELEAALLDMRQAGILADYHQQAPDGMGTRYWLIIKDLRYAA